MNNSSAHTQKLTAYLRGRDGEYNAIPVTIPPGPALLGDLEVVGPVVLVGTQHGYRATTSDLHDVGEAMIRDGQRIVKLATGIEDGTKAGPADWLELGSDVPSYRTAA